MPMLKLLKRPVSASGGTHSKRRSVSDHRSRNGRVSHVRPRVFGAGLSAGFGDRIGSPKDSPQKELIIRYKEYELQKKYKADFVCFNQIILEIKACEALTTRDEAQLINYLRATKMRVGILANFCSIVKLEWKRYVI